ncbi:hypothetical protein DL93DRAFT_2092511 [Clavulina sp. PMI_390]|nr:hypothetical protein DL93DRAFT_2092511 [Clavulina sp. PMI_390]
MSGWIISKRRSRGRRLAASHSSHTCANWAVRRADRAGNLIGNSILTRSCGACQLKVPGIHLDQKLLVQEQCSSHDIFLIPALLYTAGWIPMMPGLGSALFGVCRMKETGPGSSRGEWRRTYCAGPKIGDRSSRSHGREWPPSADMAALHNRHSTPDLVGCYSDRQYCTQIPSPGAAEIRGLKHA